MSAPSAPLKVTLSTLPKAVAASCASLWSESFVAAPSFSETATSVGGSVNAWRSATSVAGLPASASP
jgi:hypothetical protein